MSGFKSEPTKAQRYAGKYFSYDTWTQEEGILLLAGIIPDTAMIRNNTNNPSLKIQWQHGDFNYDRKVNLADLALLAKNFTRPNIEDQGEGIADGSVQICFYIVPPIIGGNLNGEGNISC